MAFFTVDANSNGQAPSAAKITRQHVAAKPTVTRAAAPAHKNGNGFGKHGGKPGNGVALHLGAEEDDAFEAYSEGRQ